ncbi:hypothetical protein [Paenibacillus paeoniae]|uniref:Uncharacterized protein n=1 Tax=Paenibacillus paeoniae TaxID=2292705 RepID=A0A371PLW1_9BACL|nr:hypothetical protein [Paenibacillus paeoniae]REK76985.1 hypothetical protein DX130_08230 [Paenibacillus paeoniae]
MMQNRLQLRYWLVIILITVSILQACSGNESKLTQDDTVVGIPILQDVQSIQLLDSSNSIVTEHQEPALIQQLLQGMKEAHSSHIDDPEHSGKAYTLVLSNSDERASFSLQDLSESNAPDVSVKLYTTQHGEEGAKAWSLPTAWIQLLLQPDTDKMEPRLIVSLDEDSDTATLVANRNIDRLSLTNALQSTLYVKSIHGDASAEYTMDWTDDRRVVIGFPNLPKNARAEFILDEVLTADGNSFNIHSPLDSRLITIRQGIAWSGLYWIDTTGKRVSEHGFDSAVLVMPSSSTTHDPEFVVYNMDRTAFRLNIETDEIKDITLKEWGDDPVRYMADNGVNLIYSYVPQRDLLFVARGLEHIYRVESNGVSTGPLYSSDRPIYGMSASPDGKHVAILLDSSGSLGPDADVLVIDADGKLVSEFKGAAYSGHSDGWHFIYSVTWSDNETIKVPMIGSSGEEFLRGKAFIHYKKGLQKKEENETLSEDDDSILRASIDGWDDFNLLRVLVKPDDPENRYVAVTLSGSGSWLIDRKERQSRYLGSGPVISWTKKGQVVVWDSTEGKLADYTAID